jgi:diguanylate cyclase (GGDEF)-like protein
MAGIPLIFSIVFSSICIISSFLGLYTLYSNPRSATNRTFFALSIALFIWSFGFAMAISAPDISNCLFWRRFAAIGWGVFFSILLHFLISLTGRISLLNKWWKYALLYLPALICLLVFTYIPGINPNQFNLVKTDFGWVNISIKNFWDWFFISYYVSYPVIGLAFVWKWGRSENSWNAEKQSKIILVSFIITLILGAFFETVVNNVFDIKIPQVAPIIMVLPVISVSYAMQRYGLFRAGSKASDMVLFDEQIRTRIIHYVADSLFAASILNIITMYFIFDEKDIASTLLFSGFLVMIGLVFETIQKMKRSTKLKDFLYAAVFFVMIPITTLNFIEYGGVTVWAVAFIYLIISIAMVSKIIQIAVAVSIILTQLAVFILKPVVILPRIDAVDYVGRLGISALAIWIALFVMSVFKSKLSENAYQISFQKLVADISQCYVSANGNTFDDVTNDTLCMIGEFLKPGAVCICLLNNEKDTIVCSYSWANQEITGIEKYKEIKLNDCPYVFGQLTDGSILEIYDTNDLAPIEHKETELLAGGNVRSLVMMPIENNNNVYGYLVLKSFTEKKLWNTIDKNNLKIITNIVAETIERIRQEKQINYMAYYDALTGLPNRTLFRDRLTQAVLHAKRYNGMFAVIFMDLDSFKYVNDTIGHEGGDDLILKVSQKLSESLRKSDSVSRFGGDEFLLMFNNISNTENVCRIADKIINIFKEPFTARDQEIYISVSAGVAVYPYDGEDADTLIRNADIAMYQAKSKGKGQYCLCTEDMKEEVRLKHELSNKLYRAIDNNELLLHYQPMVSAKTGEILSVEALVRWDQPEHGIIYPGVFIPLAEQNGLIGAVGEWVLKTACSQTKQWVDMGYENIRIAVNVSVLQLRNSKFVSTVKSVLEETGLGPGHLDLEITESVAVKESENMMKALAELKEFGVGISIDDFGTEYSSLSRLNHMPANRVKIDMSFIKNLFKSDKDRAIVNGMVHLSHTLGLKTVAEGVEHESQFEFLRHIGCDEIQGYFVHGPVPAEDIRRLLEETSDIDEWAGSVSAAADQEVQE